VDEGDARGVGIVRLLEGTGQLEQFGSSGGDAVGEHWAAIEPAWGLVWSGRSPQPIGKRPVLTGALESFAFTGEVGESREVGEDR
jgi:hypothetical protein